MWNNRVVSKNLSYSVHEVYYDQEGNPNAVSENPVPAYGDSLEELTQSMAYQMKALAEPVLDYKMFVHEKDARYLLEAKSALTDAQMQFKFANHSMDKMRLSNVIIALENYINLLEDSDD